MTDLTVRTERLSNIVVITACNENALAWLQENLQTEPWQWLGLFSVGIDIRYLGDILNGAREAGLEVERE